jgi:hypothetical protein
MLDIFLPTFLKTFAIVLGIGGGALVIATVSFVLLLATYPITRRLK